MCAIGVFLCTLSESLSEDGSVILISILVNSYEL